MNEQDAGSHLLAIGAHPDDIEFGMGGILLKEAAAGARLAVVLTSRGEGGSSGSPEQRADETLAAARLLGAEESLSYLDFGGDGKQVASTDNAIKLARLIRKVRPSMVFAPSTEVNQHPDHVAVGSTVRNACRLARYAGMKAFKDAPPHTVDSLWFYAITPGAEPKEEGSVLVDISDVFDDWIALMNCHQSQVSSRRYVDLQVARARQYGLLAGCDHAMALWPCDPPVVDRISRLPRSARSF